MNAYTPQQPLLLALACLGVLVIGLVLTRSTARRWTTVAAWLLALGGTLGVERLAANEPPGVRMLALIVALLWGMKAVVTVAARRAGEAQLTVGQWLCFAALWPGMRPGSFAKWGGPPRHGAGRLALQGALHLLAGAALIALAWWMGQCGWRNLLFLPLLPGLSLVLHFGLFNLIAAAWRCAGVEVSALFRSPLASGSLGDFWGRRWNLAFSEMTAQVVYRPAVGTLGPAGAVFLSFLVSGVLHEVAISLPVGTGLGLPLAYFALHGLLVLVERRLALAGWGRWRSAWVLGWLALPAPVLFHPAFLDGVLGPLVGR